MKHHLLVALIVISSLNCFSQTKFEKGYFINNENQKIECLIKNLDWRNNPKEFKYKTSNTSESLTATIEEVKELGIGDTYKYNRFVVGIDRSSNNIARLDRTGAINLNNEQLFLRTIIEGKATLYEYRDKDVERFFFKVDRTNISQLIFKRYNDPYKETVIKENTTYKQQLWLNLKCPCILKKDIESINYNQNDLIRIFEKYNTCNNPSYENALKTEKRDLFNLTVRPGFNSSTMSITFDYPDAGDIDFGNSSSFRFGIEGEFIMPFNNNRWSLLVEPTYQYFKSENSDYGQLIMADYKSIELPIGIRSYFFLNDKSKIFINGLYISEFSVNSSIKFENNQNFVLDPENNLEIIGRNNFAFGCGYNYNNKYSMEIRYGFNREIFNSYPNWSSKYNTLSIIFGYSIF